ncbi:hypothetical protein [Streptomyces sp. 5-6(2022)]|uniref:hypothetical protein n=1 Tax=Streptomyces sp. 5-6(2022) TaxID=2936510 RepID=UPI0031BBB785
MRGRVEDFLDATAMELEFTGFATEADYQHYVDAYALPAFMLIAGLIAGEHPTTDHREACRVYIDGSQRLDFVNDLAEDLADGRAGTVPGAPRRPSPALTTTRTRGHRAGGRNSATSPSMASQDARASLGSPASAAASVVAASVVTAE